MFYCDACAKKNKWPDGFSKSRGGCEVCGNTAVCSDVPSSALPAPPPPPPPPPVVGLIEVYKSPYGGQTLVIGDDKGGHRLAGGKVGGGPMIHQFKVNLDELITEATALRARLRKQAKEVPVYAIATMNNAQAMEAITKVILDLVVGQPFLGLPASDRKVNAKEVLRVCIARSLSDTSGIRANSFCVGSTTTEGTTTYRLIDRCLQKLRKAGKIQFVRGEWVSV